ncbi:hypothetical protein Tco_1408630 [Tanacetum coccineum]
MSWRLLKLTSFLRQGLPDIICNNLIKQALQKDIWDKWRSCSCKDTGYRDFSTKEKDDLKITQLNTPTHQYAHLVCQNKPSEPIGGKIANLLSGFPKRSFHPPINLLRDFLQLKDSCTVHAWSTFVTEPVRGRLTGTDTTNCFKQSEVCIMTQIVDEVEGPNAAVRFPGQFHQ